MEMPVLDGAAVGVVEVHKVSPGTQEVIQLEPGVVSRAQHRPSMDSRYPQSVN
jgi:hypothetical protein